MQVWPFSFAHQHAKESIGTLQRDSMQSKLRIFTAMQSFMLGVSA